MKKHIIFTMLLCASMFTFGQSPTSMYIQTEDGTTQTILLVTIQKITFEADVLLLKTSEGAFRLPMDDIRTIRFNQDDTAVENIEPDAIRITKDGNQLQIACDYAIQQLYLIDLSGKVLINERLASSITLPSSGVFILFLETSQGYIARKVIHN